MSCFLVLCSITDQCDSVTNRETTAMKNEHIKLRKFTHLTSLTNSTIIVGYVFVIFVEFILQPDTFVVVVHTGYLFPLVPYVRSFKFFIMAYP